VKKDQWLRLQKAIGKRSTSKRTIAKRLAYVRSTNGLPLSGIPLAILPDATVGHLRPLEERLAVIRASDEPLPTFAIRTESGKTDKPRGKPTLFAVIRSADLRKLRFWAKVKAIRLGRIDDISHLGYVKCLSVEILGDGSSLPFFQTGWLVGLWHTIPRQKLTS